MPPPALSALARSTISHAFKELERIVTPNDARGLNSITLEQVKHDVLKIEEELAARQALRNMRRLAPLFHGLQHYEKVMDVLCNGTPFLSWVWGPISLILRVASDHLSAFDQILKGYSSIGECLGRFVLLDSTFKTNQDFQQTLAVFYADILQFHKYAYQFVRRSGWKLLFLTSWHRFQNRFDHIFENLRRHEELLDKEANAQNIAEARQMRQQILAWRGEASEQLQRDEEERGIKQFESTRSWLRADESDQLAIFHTLSEEGTKHPGTCDWILRNKKMASMLQSRPEVPLLWLQGAAGTGKSILASSIVTFMKNAGSVVLSHFCNYSYPSSAKYELILRSLLLQLVREDRDLAAYVYQSYVMSKKAPSVPMLEALLQTLITSIGKEPRQTTYLWIVLDGIDECDPGTQNSVLSLINRLASRVSNPDGTICKVLTSCRFSAATSAKLRRAQAISLTDEKEHVNKSIRQYAIQRLQSLYGKLQQVDLTDDDVKEIEDAITNKSNGMFLYARLVLDYLSNNIFFDGQEIKKSVYELPAKLSEFYNKIMTQIIVRLDRRSVDRVKCALGWIAFSKRPLKKVEFLSAVAFTTGDANVKHTAPQYMLDICATLIEERQDTRLEFIHVSVKEFLQSSSSNLELVEIECLIQHGIATITCLTAGIEAFSMRPPPEQVLTSILKGLHGFHLYSKEHWTDYLLSLASSTEDDKSETYHLFSMAEELARRLSEPQWKRHCEFPPGDDVPPGQQQATLADERIPRLRSHLLQNFVNTSLSSRSLEQMKRKVEQADALEPENTVSVIPPPEDGISLLLHRYQSTLRYLLGQTDYTSVTAAELDSFKRNFRTSAYTCRLGGCPRATDGFEQQTQCHEHELTHVQRLLCTFPSCPYPAFISPRALHNHVRRCHEAPLPRKSIRRKGNLIRPSTTLISSSEETSAPTKPSPPAVQKSLKRPSLDETNDESNQAKGGPQSAPRPATHIYQPTQEQFLRMGMYEQLNRDRQQMINSNNKALQRLRAFRANEQKTHGQEHIPNNLMTTEDKAAITSKITQVVRYTSKARSKSPVLQPEIVLPLPSHLATMAQSRSASMFPQMPFSVTLPDVSMATHPSPEERDELSDYNNQRSAAAVKPFDSATMSKSELSMQKLQHLKHQYDAQQARKVRIKKQQLEKQWKSDRWISL